ncbi:protein of unknown function [Tenacibaculum sp. 190524A02b]
MNYKGFAYGAVTVGLVDLIIYYFVADSYKKIARYISRFLIITCVFIYAFYID